MKRFALILSAILAVVVLGCSKPSSDSSIRNSQGMELPATGLPDPEKSPFNYDSWETGQRIMKARVAFATHGIMTWKDSLKFNEFQVADWYVGNASRMVDAIAPDKGPVVPFDSLGVTEVQARAIMKATAMNAAKAMVKVLRTGWSEQLADSVTAGAGYNQLYWGYTLDVVNKLQEMVKYAGTEYKDIGTSSSEVRNLLARGIKANVRYNHKLFFITKEGSYSDCLNPALDEADAAIKAYGFTDAEVGVTSQDRKIQKERNAPPDSTSEL